MSLYRKAKPDELHGATVLKDKPAPYRPINSYADIILSPDDPRLVETPVETRRPVETRKGGDRHKDPKAHSAKVAARARARRAAK